MTERRTLGDLDFDYGVDDPDDGWYGRALVTPDDTAPWHPQAEAAEPLAMRELDDPPPRDVPPRDVPRHQTRDDPEDTPWTGILAPRNGRHGVAPTRSWESRLSNSGAWDFKVSAAGPWYRSKRVLTATGAVALAALVLTGVLVLSRGSAAGVQEPTSGSPTNPTSAGPAPSSPAPALSTVIAPPPAPLPPPPPPSAEQITAPAPTRVYTAPRRSAPTQSDMPEIGVTRTPVTRAPMSATPPPPPRPDRNSSKPGDAPKGGWGPW